MRRGIIELTFGVTLNSLDVSTGPSQHPGEEVRKGGEGVRLTEREIGLHLFLN
jgi:hypothetical protein